MLDSGALHPMCPNTQKLQCYWLRHGSMLAANLNGHAIISNYRVSWSESCLELKRQSLWFFVHQLRRCSSAMSEPSDVQRMCSRRPANLQARSDGVTPSSAPLARLCALSGSARRSAKPQKLYCNGHCVLVNNNNNNNKENLSAV